MNERGYLPPEVHHEEACTGCQSCMVSCPDFAVAVEKDKTASLKDEENSDA
jgi:NAD-dependent dihydropyrimidine dehydrogenase PreA subunit